MKEKRFVFLMHLGGNMWQKPDNAKLYKKENIDWLYRDYLVTDDATWRTVTDFLPGCGINTLLIDMGEAVELKSHPELAVRGSWSQEKFKDELKRLRSIGLEPLPKFLKVPLAIISGSIPVQKSYSKWMKTPGFLAEEVVFDTPVRWKSTQGDIEVSGRCIGGCIDVLKDLIGTKFDGAKKFVRKYKDEGIIWYFDTFSLSAEVFYRTLVQMRYAGWFEGTRAVIVGRVLFESSETGMSYEDAIHLAFPEIPVLYQADVGHTLPHMTMINGAVLHLTYRNKKASLSFLTES
jgi:hypothetical protein